MISARARLASVAHLSFSESSGRRRSGSNSSRREDACRRSLPGDSVESGAAGGENRVAFVTLRNVTARRTNNDLALLASSGRVFRCRTTGSFGGTSSRGREQGAPERPERGKMRRTRANDGTAGRSREGEKRPENVPLDDSNHVGDWDERTHTGQGATTAASRRTKRAPTDAIGRAADDRSAVRARDRGRPYLICRESRLRGRREKSAENGDASRARTQPSPDRRARRPARPFPSGSDGVRATRRREFAAPRRPVAARGFFLDPRARFYSAHGKQFCPIINRAIVGGWLYAAGAFHTSECNGNQIERRRARGLYHHRPVNTR